MRPDYEDLVAAAAADLARIAHVFDAATREGVGCLVLRDPTGRLVGVWVDDDVPAGTLREAVTDHWERELNVLCAGCPHWPLLDRRRAVGTVSFGCSCGCLECPGSSSAALAFGSSCNLGCEAGIHWGWEQERTIGAINRGSCLLQVSRHGDRVCGKARGDLHLASAGLFMSGTCLGLLESTGVITEEGVSGELGVGAELLQMALDMLCVHRIREVILFLMSQFSHMCRHFS